MNGEEPTVPQWICTHCFIHLVNGDCTETDTCDPDTWSDDSGPLHKFGDINVTPGMLWEYHTEECNAEAENGHDVCDCETNPFSWFVCDGCGCNLGGERHAVTGWIKTGD